MPEHKEAIPRPRRLRGVVASDKMQETAVVVRIRKFLHPKVKRYVKVAKKFKAHNPRNEYHIGDEVILEETRPLSKEKRWRIVGKA